VFHCNYVPYDGDINYYQFINEELTRLSMTFNLEQSLWWNIQTGLKSIYQDS